MSDDKGKFTVDQLEKRGFSECPDTGVWRKIGSGGNNSGPSTPKLESNTRSGSKKKHRSKAGAERTIRYCDKKNYRYTLVISSHRTRFIDFSNAALKWIEDRLTHWGFIPDDSPEYCDQPLVFLHKVKAGNEKTTIRLYRYESEKLQK